MSGYKFDARDAESPDWHAGFEEGLKAGREQALTEADREIEANPKVNPLLIVRTLRARAATGEPT